MAQLVDDAYKHYVERTGTLPGPMTGRGAEVIGARPASGIHRKVESDSTRQLIYAGRFGSDYRRRPRHHGPASTNSLFAPVLVAFS